MSQPPSSDHSILVDIATSLARLESKVDALVLRIDSLDKRLDDHETRLRRVEAVDMVTADELAQRDLEARKSRRWIVGIGVTIALAVVAQVIAVGVAVLN
jgi:hypothetical protein